jgi:sugar lactone lactonase YvrE
MINETEAGHVHDLLALAADLIPRPPEDQIATVTDAVRRRSRRRQRRNRDLLVGTLATSTAMVIALAVTIGRGTEHVETARPAGDSASVVGTVDALVTGHWDALPAAPLMPRGSAAVVWTGRYLIVWGGESQAARPFADGAAYDPALNRWRMLPPSPLAARSNPGAVWTGQEMIVYGGLLRMGTAGPVTAADAAAFDVSTWSWHRLSVPPLDGRGDPQLVWTGREVIAMGGYAAHGPPEAAAVAAYVPATNRWMLLPSPPVVAQGLVEEQAVWTGQRLILLQLYSYTVGNAVLRRTAELAYDPAVNRWSSDGLSPDTTHDIAGALWTGTALFVPAEPALCQLPQGGQNCTGTPSLPGRLYDPTTQASTMIPVGPLDVYDGIPGVEGSAAVTWTGSAVFGLSRGAMAPTMDHDVVEPGRAAAFDPGTDRWQTLPSGPPASAGGTLFWTGTQVLDWGAGRSGTAGFRYTPGPPRPTALDRPESLATEPDGSLLIDNQGVSQILRREPDGATNVVAGTGEWGFSGDNGPAPDARLDHPGGMAVAADGTIYVADTANNRIRAISPDGVITTVAGDGRSASVWTAQRATAAPLSQPLAVAVDPSGDLYIADDAGVQKVTPSGALSTIVRAGASAINVDGAPNASFPDAIAADRAGDLYVSDFSPKLIVELSGTGQVLRSWTPYVSYGGLTPGPDGSILVADYGNFAIDRIVGGQLSSAVAFTLNSVPGLTGGALRPSGVAPAPGGGLYVTGDGISGGAGPTLVAVDATGRAHVLIPVAAGAR